jgi:hypothetical protein
MSCVGMPSDGIMFIPNFVKISQLVKKFIWGTRTMHTQHSNLQDIHFASVNKQSRVEWKYCITILLHKGSKASTYTTLQHISLYFPGSVRWQDDAIPPTYRQLEEYLQEQVHKF